MSSARWPRITVPAPDLGRAQRAVARVFREFDRMHRDLHAWQPGELLALNEAIARGEKDVATTAEIATLIQEARQFSERSGDLFNPAIGKLVALWSFHRDKPGGPLPDPSEIVRIVRADPRMADLTVRGTTVSSSNPAGSARLRRLRERVRARSGRSDPSRSGVANCARQHRRQHSRAWTARRGALAHRPGRSSQGAW
jgi:hypothetical protein